MLAFCVFLLVALLRCSSGFVVVPAAARSRALSCRHPAVDLVRAAPGSDENLRPDVAAQMDEIRGQTLARIEDLVKGNTVMLFMKGNKFFPQCGFSNTAVQILRSCDVEFETSDVLSDPDIRQYVKEYSQWPTIPQLYIGGEFVGGSDILIEMFQSGDLKTMLEESGAKFTAS